MFNICTDTGCRMHFEGKIQWADKQCPSSVCGPNLHKLKSSIGLWHIFPTIDLN